MSAVPIAVPVPALYGSSQSVKQILSKINSSCGRWPHDFLGQKAPEQWTKAFVEKLFSLVTNSVANNDFAELLAFLEARENAALVVEDLVAAQNWQNEKRALRRSSQRAASQVLGQREPNDPRFMGQTISSNNKRKNPLPLDNTRSRPSPAEPGQPLPDQSETIIIDAYKQLLQNKMAELKENAEKDKRDLRECRHELNAVRERLRAYDEAAAEARIALAEAKIVDLRNEVQAHQYWRNTLRQGMQEGRARDYIVTAWNACEAALSAAEPAQEAADLELANSKASLAILRTQRAQDSARKQELKDKEAGINAAIDNRPSPQGYLALLRVAEVGGENMLKAFGEENLQTIIERAEEELGIDRDEE
ncbi:hypothetical protein HG530_014632 [Fusarium avenaceum]|nr:hypothetical protein HG530_014632 [Fusarium avenaceum]